MPTLNQDIHEGMPLHADPKSGHPRGNAPTQNRSTSSQIYAYPQSIAASFPQAKAVFHSFRDVFHKKQ
ncbi:MAG: hypothetical protein F6K28_28405 [Microcoleus sp. SIO2G3]|nr:hypothetical protein [Microcoleus sp. SIO2G3]